MNLGGMVGCIKLAFGLVAAFLLMLPFPAIADNNRGFSIEEYEAVAARRPNIGIDPRAMRYLDGIMLGFHAARMEYGKIGQKPLFCSPPGLKTIGLYELMADELGSDGDTWRRAPDATAAKLALHVLRRSYPCSGPVGLPEKFWQDMSMFGFRMMVMLANDGNRDGIMSVMAFFSGLREAMMAASDVYAATGAKRRLCIPSGVETPVLIHAIGEELDRNDARWTGYSDDSIVPVALQVFADKWPCP